MLCDMNFLLLFLKPKVVIFEKKILACGAKVAKIDVILRIESVGAVSHQHSYRKTNIHTNIHSAALTPTFTPKNLGVNVGVT